MPNKMKRVDFFVNLLMKSGMLNPRAACRLIFKCGVCFKEKVDALHNLLIKAGMLNRRAL